MKNINLLFIALVFSAAFSTALAAFPPTDRVKPTVPQSLTAVNVLSDHVDLTWTKSTDNVRVAGYTVYSLGSRIADTRANSFTFKATPLTSYSFTVSAFDAARNRSQQSTDLAVTTPAGGGGEPPPPPNPNPTNVVGYLGCSMTMGAVDGAGAGNVFWNSKPHYGGGGLYQWSKSLNNAFWTAFQTSLEKQPTTTIWWELCALSEDAANETYDQALVVLDEIKRRVPGALIYVSAQPAYAPSSHECVIAGQDGQARMARIAAELTAAGDVIAGPVVGPLNYPAETLIDGCHGNTTGNRLIGKQIADFFLKVKPPGPTVPLTPGIGAQARGLYVVDDNDPDFATALGQAFVDGALIRVKWQHLESTDDVFNFSTLCSKIEQAAKIGKKVSLVNYALAPSWLLSKAPTADQWQHPAFSTQPVPWNALAQSELQELATTEANFICGGYKIKEHPALAEVDTPIVGMMGIRNAPAYTLSIMTQAAVANAKLWHDAFAVPDDKKMYYMSLFPLGKGASAVADSKTLWTAITALYPDQHGFMENWDITGPSGSLIEPYKAAKYHGMQACNYFSQPDRIKCSGSGQSGNTPKAAYDKILKPLGVKSIQIYPDDLNYPSYKNELESIHTEIWQ